MFSFFTEFPNPPSFLFFRSPGSFRSVQCFSLIPIALFNQASEPVCSVDLPLCHCAFRFSPSHLTRGLKVKRPLSVGACLSGPRRYPTIECGWSVTRSTSKGAALAVRERERRERERERESAPRAPSSPPPSFVVPSVPLCEAACQRG